MKIAWVAVTSGSVVSADSIIKKGNQTT